MACFGRRTAPPALPPASAVRKFLYVAQSRPCRDYRTVLAVAPHGMPARVFDPIQLSIETGTMVEGITVDEAAPSCREP